MKSIAKKVRFTCPKCKEVHEITCYEQLGPDKLEDIKNATVFQWDCESCGHKVKLIYPTYYCNIDKEFVVFLMPNATDVECISIEQQQLFKGFTMRLCKNADSFVEKIRVLESNLDDRAIELLKLMTFAKVHVQNKTIEDIFFYRKSESRSLEFTLMYQEDIDGIDIDDAMYQNVVSIVKEELPSLTEGVHCIDLEWAGKQVIM